MHRKFNITGACNSQYHYMVNIQNRLEAIKSLVDAGDYITINRARQYGKTTLLTSLVDFLKNDYIVISLDFQMMSNRDFMSEEIFTYSFAEIFIENMEEYNKESLFQKQALDNFSTALSNDKIIGLRSLFSYLSKLCASSSKPMILIIDEIDSATNNQVFLDFLSQLRAYYLARNKKATFQSVILAGVYDIKNLQYKIRSEEEHKLNSPWNIATDFTTNMSFCSNEIAKMLSEYESDYHTKMDINAISNMIYDYTSGYPFLVSKICKILDEKFSQKEFAWTKEYFLESIKILLSEKNTLFDSLINKLIDYPELKTILSSILFEGKEIPYVSTNSSIELAEMFGFIKNHHNTVKITNRIFETVLYNHLLSEETIGNKLYDSALIDKNEFITNGHLNMTFVLKRFIEIFDDLYGEENERFLEEVGRKYFMLFLKPIINGTGHSYVESRTRNRKRTDIIVDYCGEQFIIELKIWSGSKYHFNGENQIAEYLDFYHLKKGYMLIFNFNKKKEIGVKEIKLGDKILVEAMV